jgi:hypothetical protein
MRDQAILNTHPSVTRIVGSADAYDINGNPVVLDESLIATETARLQTESDATQYQRDRAAAYAPLGDQMDMQYWDALNSTTTWADHIARVKEDYPK